MPGFGDEITTGGRGPLRASDADREQVVNAIKAAFVQGRLAKDEFALRVGQVLASRTYADLDLLTADIPAGLAKARATEAVATEAVATEVRAPEPARNPENRKFITRAIVAVGSAGMVVTDAILLPRYPVAGLFAGAFVGFFAAALMAGLLTFLSWVLGKSSGKRPSKGERTEGTGTRSAAPTADPGRRPPYTLATAAS